MIITPLQQFTIDFRRADFTRFGEGRDPQDIHLGTLIRLQKEAAGEKVSGIEGEQDNLRAQMGFLWERAIEMAWIGVPFREALEIVWKEYVAIATIQEIPERGPITTQLSIKEAGIKQTPDGVDEGTLWLESYKFTYRSMRKWIEDCQNEFWSWHAAESAYLRTLNLSREEGKKLQGCRYIVFWANGDYTRKPGHGPQATFTQVQWTDSEVEGYWRTHLRYRDYALQLRSQEAA